MELKKERILFPNQVEKDEFCRAVFEKTQIAPCNCEFVCQTKVEGANILRIPCHRKFYSSDIVAYQLGIYALIYRAHTDEILFTYENKGNFEIFPWGSDGFYLKRRLDEAFEIESYKLEKDGWLKTSYPQNVLPKGYEEARRAGRRHEWQIVRPHKEGIKSVDNTIYYRYYAATQK